MVWLLRLLLVFSASITSLFVARDALNFGFMQTIVTVILAVVVVSAISFTAGRTR